MTDLERRAIRRRKEANPSHKQDDIAEWFQQQFHVAITQGMVSKALDSKYAYLDTDKRKPHQLSKSKRSAVPDWPALEGALFEWQQKMQKKKAIITGDILKEKAHEIWQLLPQYSDVEEPTWSNGWLEGFKKRHNIKKYSHHGEAGSAGIKELDNIY